MNNYYLKYKKYKTKYLNLQSGGESAFVGATVSSRAQTDIQNRIKRLQSNSDNNEGKEKEKLAAEINELEIVVKEQEEAIKDNVEFIKNTLEEIAKMKKQLEQM